MNTVVCIIIRIYICYNINYIYIIIYNIYIHSYNDDVTFSDGSFIGTAFHYCQQAYFLAGVDTKH